VATAAECVRAAQELARNVRVCLSRYQLALAHYLWLPRSGSLALASLSLSFSLSFSLSLYLSIYLMLSLYFSLTLSLPPSLPLSLSLFLSLSLSLTHTHKNNTHTHTHTHTHTLTRCLRRYLLTADQILSLRIAFESRGQEDDDNDLASTLRASFLDVLYADDDAGTESMTDSTNSQLSQPGSLRQREATIISAPKLRVSATGSEEEAEEVHLLVEVVALALT
jgi:hypothetical protein